MKIHVINLDQENTLTDRTGAGSMHFSVFYFNYVYICKNLAYSTGQH